MRPDRPTTDAFRYCLGVAAQSTNVGIVAYVASSNHWHGVVVDHDGRLPQFLHSFHLLFAKHQNRLRGRWENFWASQQTSVVELIDEEDIVDKCAYVLANPVKDQLVERAHLWPGASSLVALRHPRRVCTERPTRFFRTQGGTLPSSSTIKLCVPPGVDSAQFRRRIDQRISDIESTAQEQRRCAGTRVLGAQRVLRQSWEARPLSIPPRRRLSPTVACHDGERRECALRRRKWWRDVYCERRARYAAGERGVVFPAGTYALARYSGVLVEPYG